MKKIYLTLALFALLAAGSAVAVKAQNAVVFSQENGVVNTVNATSSQITVTVFNECKATSSTACAAWYSKEVNVDLLSVLVTDPKDVIISDLGKVRVNDRVRIFYKGGVAYALKVMQFGTATNPKEPGMCTMEAKLCPDGKTYVGRSGPKCEFAACPGTGSATTTSSSTLPIGKRICVSIDGEERCKTIPPGLRFGMKSEQIKHLQERLQREGFLPMDAATGYFGQMTLRAVKELQKIKGLPTTGFVGDMTLEKLEDKDD